MDDYRIINESYPFEEWFATPYALAGWLVYNDVTIWKYENSDPRVLMIFEDGSKHKGDFLEVADKEKFSTPIFLKKIEATPLQAADILAWEFFRALNTGAFINKRFRPSLAALLARSIAKHEMPLQVCNLKAMQRLCESQKVPKRSDINPKSTFVFENSPKRNRRRTIFQKK
jgi:hypothetical protein